jgi:redox-sensitive bicupin YhaK (pirin superfamily)
MGLFRSSLNMNKYLHSPVQGIEAIIKPALKDLGGFSVRRYLPHGSHRKVGPFVFFDHMGPALFKPGDGIDVRPHPHIGLATITYLFEGEIIHRDNLGHVQPIIPGAVNWMTAGRGIAHSERTGEQTRQQGHTLHGLQVWVALPEEFEEVQADFLHYDQQELPVIEVKGAVIRIIIGSAFALNSPVKTHSPLFYLDIKIASQATLVIPEDYPERAIHVVDGAVTVNGYTVAAFEMAVCEKSKKIEITAGKDSRLVIFGGNTITDRFLWWNFVSSSRQRIEKAKQDWRNGSFDQIPGETEFIPLPDDH